jgi:hypothetical protein
MARLSSPAVVLLLLVGGQLVAGLTLKSNTGPSKYARYGLVRSQDYQPLM